ncbi:hypothetical protein C4901_09195 [Acidiferrobacter sp. SPIII_3]|uniref:hypothetical protein n=1 Tax=Acidiferrobacter sp. SPIII_3 TaxID=1281578 RepID=UPI000D72AE00|nr:hypothetical protein [Acidiferrobacter sp. SPIII_3]AWP23487.1 hypothetical protein C4901_09195 [Acidiferrobacter sp. SPIII_3]
MIDWDAVVEVVTGAGTLMLAVSSFVTIRRTALSEKRRYTPVVTWDFYDIGEHENLGPPGFRHLQSHRDNPELNHPALKLSGKLRNISASPAVDCRLDIYVDSSPEPIHEIRNIALHDGLGAGDSAEISRLITLDDVDADGALYFKFGVHGLFAQFSVPAGHEYPFAVVFSYKNPFGAAFFSVYRMRVDARSDKGSERQPVPTMVFKGSASGQFHMSWLTVRRPASRSGWGGRDLGCALADIITRLRGSRHA